MSLWITAFSGMNYTGISEVVLLFYNVFLLSLLSFASSPPITNKLGFEIIIKDIRYIYSLKDSWMHSGSDAASSICTQRIGFG